MMKYGWKRFAAAAVALVMLMSLLPLMTGNSSAKAVGTYGKTIANGVRVRKQPSTTADYWFRIDMGYVCELMDTVTSEGLTWYKVTVEHPDDGNTRTYVGYIHGDYFTPMTEAEAIAWEANPVQPGKTTASSTAGSTTTNTTTTNTTATSGTIGTITNGGVNFRQTEGGSVLAKLDRGTVVEVLSIPSTIDSNHWYRVRYNNQEGYIQAPFLLVTGSTVTAAPSAVTAVPSVVTATPVPSSYVKLILSSANLRTAPGGKVAAQWEVTGEVLAVTGSSVVSGGYTWYPVTYNGGAYYVRGDCVQVVSSADGSVTPTPVPTVAPTAVVTATPQANATYVKLILSSANLRTAPGGKVAAQWETTGEILLVTGTAVTADGYTWYPITYQGGAYYVRGDCVQVVSSADGSVTPTPVVTSTVTTVGYVKTIKNNVNLRLQPSGEYIQQVPSNQVLPLLANPVTSGGYTWYYVLVGNVKGYLRGDCVQECDASGNATAVVTATPAPDATATPAVSSYGYVRLTADKVNLRNKPAGSSLEQLSINLVLPVIGATVTSGNYVWYPVRTSTGTTGYVRGDCAVLTDTDGTSVTPTPTATANSSTSGYGYAMVTKSSTNVRKTPGGASTGTVEKNTVWPMTGTTTTSGGYTWYPVNVNGTAGYIRGDCAFKLSATQEASYIAGNGVPEETVAPTTAPSTYVITILDKVNLRASASKDAAAPYNISINTVMAYNSTATVGGSLWYRVVYSNTEVWVLGSCVKVMTEAEYQAYIASQPSSTPQAEVIKGYVRTTSSGVNLRTTANGSNIIGRIDKGVVMSYSQDPVTVRNYTWYYVKTSLGYGYLRGDYLVVCNQDGSDIATPTPTTTSTDGKQEATYSTLKKGSSGTEVKALVAELKNQGYYTGDITSSYTSAVEAAVRAFQTAKGLTVDGIAGKNTQHALFNTVEPGTSDTSDLTMAIYPAEKIDWYTGGIQQLWPKGSNYKVYDVKTGIVWWAHRWSGGSHVDAEPLTAADTARLCKIYGVSNADQIASKNLWQRRPCLVTIGTRTFACSLYGIPHNYPDGDTISNNNFKGQLCIHFTNSKTHASNKVDTYHTEAIQYAYDHAPNGHK